jgi:hypothetical protein
VPFCLGSARSRAHNVSNKSKYNAHVELTVRPEQAASAVADMGAYPLLPYTIPTRVHRVPSHQNPPPYRPRGGMSSPARLTGRFITGNLPRTNPRTATLARLALFEPLAPRRAAPCTQSGSEGARTGGRRSRLIVARRTERGTSRHAHSIPSSPKWCPPWALFGGFGTAN